MPTAQDTASTTLAEAVAFEEAIADEAAEIRGDNLALTGELFLKLLPLLRRPIPSGFIITTPPVKGKPYPSTGIKSLQVQIDRMDAVLTPLNWEWQTTWNESGTVADVVITVYGPPNTYVLVRRRAKGGVNQGSTQGNIFKGSETNAAKLAFARVGPGHEIYVGLADFDPDTDPDAAEAQTTGVAQPRKLTEGEVEKVRAAIEGAGLLGSLDHKLRAFGVKTLADLNHQQAFAMREWIDEKAKGQNGGG